MSNHANANIQAVKFQDFYPIEGNDKGRSRLVVYTLAVKLLVAEKDRIENRQIYVKDVLLPFVSETGDIEEFRLVHIGY